MSDIANLTAEVGDTSEFTAGVTTSGASSTFTATAGSAHSGSFGFRANTPAEADNNEEAYGRRLFTAPGSNIVELEAWMNVVTSPASSSSVVIVGLALREDANLVDYVASVNWDGLNNPQIWSLSVRRLDGSYVGTEFTFPGSGFKKWRLVYDGSGADPVITLSCDGVQLAQYTDTTTGTLRIPDQIEIGLHETQWAQTGAEVHVDDIFIRDAITSDVASGADDKRGMSRGMDRGMERGMSA